MTVTYFAAAWCAPCENLKPKVVAICDAAGVDLEVVDIDTWPAKAANAGVMTIPTVLVGELALSGTSLTPAAIRRAITEEATW